jgi:RecJ-like exonuclease
MISNLPGKCTKCGAVLIESACHNCEGTGKVRNATTHKVTTCSWCKGTGKRYTCPNIIDHIKNMKVVPGQDDAAPALPHTIPCPVCRGTGVVPHPASGAPGPCVQCGGKGWIIAPELG